MPRDYLHDYRSRCIYHITMTKRQGIADFSCISGPLADPRVERTPLGGIIEAQLRDISTLCPALRVLQYVIMPDHIHFVIFAESSLPNALGYYLSKMKVKCFQKAQKQGLVSSSIFEKDFNDRILRRHHKLDTIFNYIHQNPLRLLVRKENPDYFRRINNLSLGGEMWQAYGNLQLLENPFKAPVVLHRADPESLQEIKRSRWKHLSENGGVLVSAFISKPEKEIRAQCEKAGGKIILLSNRPLRPREKPAAHDFQQCAAGRLLILAPMEALTAGRQTFLRLNATADALCTGAFAN